MAQHNDDSTATADDRLQTTRLPVPEMNCPWNSRRIAEFLQRIDGVVETAVESRSESVIVKYDPAHTSEATISAAVENQSSGRSHKSTQQQSSHRTGGCGCQCPGGMR